MLTPPILCHVPGCTEQAEYDVAVAVALFNQAHVEPMESRICQTHLELFRQALGIRDIDVAHEFAQLAGEAFKDPKTTGMVVRLNSKALKYTGGRRG